MLLGSYFSLVSFPIPQMIKQFKSKTNINNKNKNYNSNKKLKKLKVIFYFWVLFGAYPS